MRTWNTIHTCFQKATLVTATCCLLNATLASEAPPVPDPFGLGERLALIDHLKEQYQIQVPAGTSLKELKQRYQEAHAKAQPKIDPREAVLADRKRRLLTELDKRGITDVKHLSLEELLQLQKDHVSNVQKETAKLADKIQVDTTTPQQEHDNAATSGPGSCGAAGCNNPVKGSTAKTPVIADQTPSGRRSQDTDRTKNKNRDKEPEVELHSVRARVRWHSGSSVSVELPNKATYSISLSYLGRMYGSWTPYRRWLPEGKNITLLLTKSQIQSPSTQRSAIVLIGSSSSRSLQERVLTDGLAWYRGGAPGKWHKTFIKAQESARRAKRGVWSRYPQEAEANAVTE